MRMGIPNEIVDARLMEERVYKLVWDLIKCERGDGGGC